MILVLPFEELRFGWFRVTLGRFLLLDLQECGRVKAFLLCSRCVVSLVVLIAAEDTCWLHSSAALRTENTLDLKPALQRQTTTVVTDPVALRNLIDSIAPLVHRYITYATEHD